MNSKLIYCQLTAFIFLAAFLAQTFSRTFIIADYYTNTGKYEKNCENKARPKMHCNGKCQMMKKLEQEEKRDQQNPERKTENKNEVSLSSKSFFPSISFPPFKIKSTTNTSPRSDGKSIDRSLAVFHPPQVSHIVLL